MKSFWFAVLFFNFSAFSQTDTDIVKNYTVNNYTTDNGLPQNSVKDIVFDNAGYCWLATEMGLARFDGKNFTPYTSTDIPNLKYDRMKKMGQKKDGHIYIEALNQFLEIVEPSGAQSPYPKVTDESKVKLTRNGFAVGLDYLNRLNMNFERYHILIGKDTSAVYATDNDHLYYANGKKVDTLCNLARGEEYITMLDSACVQFFLKNQIKVWCGDILQKNINQIYGDVVNDTAFDSGNFKLFWSCNGTFLYCNNKVYRLMLRANGIYAMEVITDLDIPYILCINYSTTLNAYFIGSLSRGLFVIKPNNFRYPKLPRRSEQSFYSEVLTSTNQIFCSNLLLSQDGTVVTHNTSNLPRAALYVDKNNKIYYERYNSLCAYDQTKRTERILFKLDGGLVYIKASKSDFALYFATEKSFGKIADDTLCWTQSFPYNILANGLEQISVENFLINSQKGLHWYKASTNTIYKSLLDSTFVRAIYKDGSRLWIGTYGKGFYLYENDKLYLMPLGPHQSLKTVHSFIDDGRGSFWLPTNNGLFKVLKDDLIAFAHGGTTDVFYYMFSKMDGLRTNEFNGGGDPSYLWLPDSMLSLPSLEGLAWFYPHKTKLLLPNKIIYIDHISINGQNAPFSDNHIVLPSDFSSLSIKFSSPYFGNPNNLQLEYYIKGLNNAWQILPDDGHLLLNTMPSGQYTIVVKKSLNQQETPDSQITIYVTVTTCVYHTWWFYTLVAASIVLFVYLLYRRRLILLKNNALLLNQEVEKSTSQLANTIQRLEYSEKELVKSNEVKDEIITMVLHDIRSPLRFLYLLSNNLSKTYSNSHDPVLRKKLDELKGTIGSLKVFADEFFLWASSQRKNFKIVKTNFSLQELFDGIQHLYADIVSNNSNALIFSPTNIRCYTDYNILSLILRNLIDNANKNTHNGRISVGAYIVTNEITIYISDTGNGLTAEQIKLYEAQGNEISKGLGSVLIKKMLCNIDGSLHIKSELNNGSTFSVTLNHQLSPD